MHILARERHGIDDQAVAEEYNHPPADVVVLSFSDSDLLGLERAYAAMDGGFTLRLMNLARLRHPMSADLYIEQTLEQSRCVVIRLLGGVDYWRYGAEEVRNACRARGIPLVLLPGDARDDGRLRDWSTVDVDIQRRLAGFLREAGPENLSASLRLMGMLAGYGQDDGAEPVPLPPAGVYRVAGPAEGAVGRVSVVFYRAHVLASDCAPIDALVEAFAARQIRVEALYAASLRNKDAGRWGENRLREFQPQIVVNATLFAAREADSPSPLDVAKVPVFQALQPGSTLKAWGESSRGLGQADLAMQVALPELDGRLCSAPISFKVENEPGAPARREAHAAGIEQVVQQAERLMVLQQTQRAERRVAIVLSDYPGAVDVEGQAGHAVGLDSFASLAGLLNTLQHEGYMLGDVLPDADALACALGRAADGVTAEVIYSAEAYRAAFEALPVAFREAVVDLWGVPTGPITARFLRFGHVVVALQPERGAPQDRKAQYHDPDVPPAHAYIGFYLWLRSVQDVHAVVHMGTHGTTEWLPGKAVALSESCAPSVLMRGVPVLYPFIVNNPGEAAAAKRRLGAVTIGHMTPPFTQAGSSEERGDAPAVVEIERLIDEYAEADGLDRRRSALLRGEIFRKAEAAGLLAESGVREGQDDEDAALARLDSYLCDVKDLQIRDGLHIFGQVAPKAEALAEGMAQICGVSEETVLERLQWSAEQEMRSLLAGLDGAFVEPGPAGAPSRGRFDVLPTGRNLSTVDPRAIPTPSAVTLARVQVQELLERHEQEEGEPLTQLVLDVWGSASLRTGGEDLALALLLMGVEPEWDAGSGRVSGVAVLPMAALGRPRVDVTLRISGLFRDAFPAQIALFDQAVQAVAAREGEGDENPLAYSVQGLEPQERHKATARIFGVAPGGYGTGLEAMLRTGEWVSREMLGDAYLAGNDWTYGQGRDGVRDQAVLSERLRKAEAVLHVQDHAEVDLLETADYAAHEAGLAAAAERLGGAPRIWHGESTATSLRLRDLEAEVARVVRGRLVNQRWLEGMQRHGYRGAGEISRGVEALCGFAALLPGRFDRQFDLVFAATLGDAACDAFLQEHNPDAREAIRRRMDEMVRRGLWHPRVNSVHAVLAGEA